jgi:hypothetical protein
MNCHLVSGKKLQELLAIWLAVGLFIVNQSNISCHFIDRQETAGAAKYLIGCWFVHSGALKNLTAFLLLGKRRQELLAIWLAVGLFIMDH